MTNFLNRLAGRALGMLPVAQPIIPSQFHPVAEKGRRVEGLIEDGAESSGLSDFSASIRNVRRIHNVRAAAQTAMPPSGELPPEERELQAMPSHVLRPRPQRGEDPARRPHLVMEDSVAAPHQPQQKQDQQVMPLRAEIRPVREREKLPDTADTQDSETRSSHDRRGAFAEQTLAPPSPPVSRHAEPQTRTPVANDSQAMEAPAVRVTIGRIDVRAEMVSAPAPAVSRRPRATTLSLDQYLKQRSEVRR